MRPPEGLTPSRIPDNGFYSPSRKKEREPSWKTPDIATLELKTISPGASESLKVGIPAATATLLFQASGYPLWDVHTRSRVMQRGFEVRKLSNALIRETLQRIPGKPPPADAPAYQALILVTNYTQSEIHVPKNTRLFRIIQKTKESLAGVALEKCLQAGKIAISGQQGKDWTWYTGQRKGETMKKGIVFALDPEFVKEISPGDEAIALGHEGTDLRENIDLLLAPAERSDELKLWIGETAAHLNLQYGMNALIFPTVYREDGKTAKGSEHKNSLYIGGGVTNWPVRTEIFGPTSDALIAHAIRVEFWEDDVML